MAGNNNKVSMKDRFKSFSYALNGLKHVLKLERNFHIHIIAGVTAIMLGLVFRISYWDWMMVIMCIGFVLFAEIVNTAVEKLTDMVSPQKNEIAGKVKDIAAGAVLVAAITAFVIGSVIFLPHIFTVIKQLF
jgi:diacylglycerol kinase (ATP)